MSVSKGSVKITGSTIADSQSIPMTTAQKDLAMKAYENIIDTIGAEYIKLFLPMWESTGTTFKDLLKPNLTFTASGVTLAQNGLLHPVPSFDGTNDYVIQTAVTENTTGTTDVVMDNTTTKLGTRMVAVSASAGFVRLRLKKVEGSGAGTLDSATVTVKILTDSGTVPNALVTNGTSVALACSAISTSYELRGFNFATAPNLDYNVKYWVTIEYSNATGVDASNYISWAREAANTYGERRATYAAAAWSATDAQNHIFELYNNDLTVGATSDYSIIAMAKNTNAAVGSRLIAGRAGMVAVGGVNSLMAIYIDETGAGARACDGTQRTASAYRFPANVGSIHGMTFSYTNTAAKLKNYLGGLLMASTNGTATTAQVALAQPLVIGNGILSTGALGANYWQGLIGPIIKTSSELTAAQMGKVANQLTALRRIQLSTAV